MSPDPSSRPGTDAPTPALLEREGDLAVLGGLLADVRAGEGRLAVIEGPAGIGKTRLLEEARAAADGMGLEVLYARGGELERDFGFGVVRQLLEPRVAVAEDSERADLFAGAAGLAEVVIAPQAAAAPPTGDLSRAALHGLYWLVVNLAERSPLLVAVDDLQWVDGPSLRFLHYLVMRLEGVPVAIVATLRTGETSPDPELLDGLLLAAQLLRPAALSRAAVASIVRGRLGEDAPPELCDACHESSRGNPFLLGELLLELVHDRGAAAHIDSAAGLAPAAVRQLGPPRIAKAVLLRVGRLGPDARGFARALAVLGEADEPSQAARLAGLEPAVAAAIADSLTALGVLSVRRPVRFAHPVVRTAIYHDTPASERARMRRRAAELLAGDPEQAAVHLLAADPHGDPHTVAMLRAAARAAQARGAPDSAVRYLRRALAEPPAPADRTELLAELGLTHHLLGDTDATELLLEALELTETQPARATIGLALGHQLLDSRHPQEERAVAVFERALEGLEDPMLRSMVEALILVSGPSPRAVRPLVAQRLREARARVEQLPDEQTRPLLVPLALHAAMTGTAAGTIRLAERALGDGVLVRLAPAAGRPFAYAAAVALSQAGELASAEQTLTDAIAQSRERGLEGAVAAAAAFRAHARYLAGRLAAAEADARLWLEQPAMADWPVPSAVATAALVFVLVERGRADEARRALDAFERIPQDPEAPPSQPLRAGRAYLLAAEGKPQSALEALRECERFERDWQARAGLWVAWRSQTALCQLALGDQSEARRLVDEELALARSFGAQRAIGVALHAHALVHDADQETLTEAVERLAGSDARLEHGRALIDLGSAIRRAGKRTEARATLAEGAELAHRCGATALVDHAREELRLAGARPRRIAQTGRDSLTPAELRVVELAVQGHTNKQIAQALFVTQRTVEMHLSNSYRKLDIETREQLPAALRGA
ncbi:MAG TPA: AAA family ATPase [Solirubrobacterales bacterium]|nr:AAA family ATPase [Solirubrobacterales bacterium]